MSYMLSIVSKCSFSISMYSYEFILNYVLTSFSGSLIPITLQTRISNPPLCFFLFYILLINFTPYFFTYERSSLSRGTNFCFIRQENIAKIIQISSKKTLHALSPRQAFLSLLKQNHFDFMWAAAIPISISVLQIIE